MESPKIFLANSICSQMTYSTSLLTLNLKLVLSLPSKHILLISLPPRTSRALEFQDQTSLTLLKVLQMPSLSNRILSSGNIYVWPTLNSLFRIRNGHQNFETNACCCCCCCICYRKTTNPLYACFFSFVLVSLHTNLTMNCPFLNSMFFLLVRYYRNMEGRWKNCQRTL